MRYLHRQPTWQCNNQDSICAEPQSCRRYIVIRDQSQGQARQCSRAHIRPSDHQRYTIYSRPVREVQHYCHQPNDPGGVFPDSVIVVG